MGQRRAEMTAPRNVLGTDFCLRQHLIPGRHTLISIQVWGEAGRERADYQNPEGERGWAPPMSKAGPGTHSEAAVRCLGGRGVGRALFRSSGAPGDRPPRRHPRAWPALLEVGTPRGEAGLEAASLTHAPLQPRASDGRLG